MTDEDILQVLQEASDSVLLTIEVTEQVPIKRSATYKRLSNLKDDGQIAGKRIGGRNTVWWLPKPDE